MRARFSVRKIEKIRGLGQREKMSVVKRGRKKSNIVQPVETTVWIPPQEKRYILIQPWYEESIQQRVEKIISFHSTAAVDNKHWYGCHNIYSDEAGVHQCTADGLVYRIHFIANKIDYAVKPLFYGIVLEPTLKRVAFMTAACVQGEFVRAGEVFKEVPLFREWIKRAGLLAPQ